MNKLARALRSGVALMLLMSAISCGGGNPPSFSGTGPPGPPGPPVAPAPNVASLVVDGGPTGNVNTLFTTVTVCVPGSTTACQTIDHIQVDTGSYGLRLLAQVLTLPLPVTRALNGNPLAECTVFADGYSWGPIRQADIQVAGETTTSSGSSVPVQVIGDPNFAAVPTPCSSTGPRAEDTVATFGANGLLGIGVFEQDCGPICATQYSTTGAWYYSCPPTGGCVPSTASLASQVQNPVWLFTADNNGTIIDLPTVAAPGAATVTGSLIFGIDTQTNNASGRQTVLAVDPNSGYLTTLFNGQTLSQSFIDTGSNAYYFNDSAVAACASNSGFAGFYCPPGQLNFGATLRDVNNAVSANVTFSIGNAQTIATNNPTFTVLPTLGGTYASSSNAFDWGLPFYYGRSVYTAIEVHSTRVGTGPYVAF